MGDVGEVLADLVPWSVSELGCRMEPIMKTGELESRGASDAGAW